ncbi:CDK5 and ABL1 enzyme substrate 1-like isoform X1 [Canis lupus familiaris]|uniref:CDK5 and ABL1 enzyme substrate 1-like isoform X1 n=1 Tax=Canis lupus familiaris TaxID=9615 RepID=UPI0018F5DE17|nr:CDK5 and ABL1 enzyme substrate 1-like isoform X1 [Canis lupus familiaris]XP_038526580.1 CDK5 and ABL1 enzyme substrate 1-like isoform X1 [Canis lupus familiaris]
MGPLPPAVRAAARPGPRRPRCGLPDAPGNAGQEELEEDDAFCSVQVPAAAFLGSGTPGSGSGSRGRLNSFTQGILPIAFARPTSQNYCALEQPAQGASASALEQLQRSRRRLISQRSSLETLEDIEENAPLRRCPPRDCITGCWGESMRIAVRASQEPKGISPLGSESHLCLGDSSCGAVPFLIRRPPSVPTPHPPPPL